MATVTVYTHVVNSINHAWVTKDVDFELFANPVINFWFNPSDNLTLLDVAGVIGRDIDARIRRMTVRGQVIQREDMDDYTAAQNLREGESFNCQLMLIPSMRTQARAARCTVM